jgi:hypothetical protein
MRKPPTTPDGESWASAMRSLIEAGKPAVPRLAQELDETNRYDTMQALGFVLRGIGDARAVPSLIRAIPRVLRTPDQYEMQDHIPIKKNGELLKFVRQFDGGEYEKNSEFLSKNDKNIFLFGGQKPEIVAALQKITGEQDDGWIELQQVALRGGAYQRNLERKVFLRYARRWADWWAKNWQKHLDREADAELDSIAEALERYERDLPDLPIPERTEIPSGRKAFMEKSEHHLWKTDLSFKMRAFDETPDDLQRYMAHDDSPQPLPKDLLDRLPSLHKKWPCIFDLDTGRAVLPPEELSGYTAGGVAGEPSRELLDWSAKEGCHFVVYRVKKEDGKRTFLVAKPINVKLWLASSERAEKSGGAMADRFAKLEKEILGGKKIELPGEWRHPVAHFDETAKQYDESVIPMFYFITKSGVCGILMIQRSDPLMPSDTLWIRYVFENESKK